MNNVNLWTYPLKAARLEKRESLIGFALEIPEMPTSLAASSSRLEQIDFSL